MKLSINKRVVQHSDHLHFPTWMGCFITKCWWPLNLLQFWKVTVLGTYLFTKNHKLVQHIKKLWQHNTSQSKQLV